MVALSVENKKFHTVADLRRSIEDLQQAMNVLSQQREFLLSQAIPKLEHEYLYCISQLELEASTLEGELHRLSTIVSFYRSAADAGTIPQQEELNRRLSAVAESEGHKILRHQYKQREDHSIIPVMDYERDEIHALSQAIIKQLALRSNGTGADQDTMILRRFTDSYRSGNIGELRALRVILEGKQSAAVARERKKSFIASRIGMLKMRFSLFLRKLFPSSESSKTP